ncbi:MAG: hypothetical protein KME46_29780 [Brasilonema angustatum HA4187-MV1]|jgi:chromosome segregation ATPase|nr:hypothetical protein [Brasilonema angustatum HA4187-MV1]
MQEVMTSTQKCRKVYEDNYFKVTVRIDPSFKPKLDQLTRQFGSQKAALEYAIVHAGVSSRFNKNNVEKLEHENREMSATIENLKEQIRELKAQKQVEESNNQLLDEAIAATQKRSELPVDIEQAFLDFQSAQDSIY